MRRRAFITTLGCICAWPLSLRAQQAVPVVGLLRVTSPEANPDVVQAFRQGLKEVGYVEGENLEIQYRWTDDQIDKLALLAAGLVRRKVAVIVAASPAPALAAKAATATTPIVFMVSADPVQLGLVASLARPDGNLTGVNFFLAEMAAKRLELLRELVPTAARVAVLINPANAAIAEATLRDAEVAARAMKLEIQVLNANTSREIDEAFAIFSRALPDALMVSSGPFFFSRRVQLAQLAARYAIPTMYAGRQHVEVGGLISYATSVRDAYRQAGVYAGRILNGAKPADLPVVQSTKFELVINHQTARQLGLTVPPSLLARADEVIE